MFYNKLNISTTLKIIKIKTTPWQQIKQEIISNFYDTDNIKNEVFIFYFI